MIVRMLAGLAMALLLDARLRRRQAAHKQWAAGAAIGGEAGQTPPPFTPRVERELSDDELVARVLAMADVPPGVEVTAVDGAVVLFGRVARFAFAPLLSRVARVPGVADVEDRLTPVDDLGANEPA